jgi:hypothetical protein
MDENTEITDHWLEYLHARETQDVVAAEPDINLSSGFDELREGFNCPVEPETRMPRELNRIIDDVWKSRPPEAVPCERLSSLPIAPPAVKAELAQNVGERFTLRRKIGSWFPFRRIRKFR